ncbi:Ig-like domain-containing protein [Parabacteroides chinchillae]
MNDKYIRNSLQLFAGLFLLVAIYSCANMATPTGGPYDENPPKFISSTPAPNQTNYKGKKVEILFDELIQIDKPSENVIITPPQMELPIVRTAGRKAVVELMDTLKPNTTYTIDFTNSISDNNEKNVFENFSFAFSTGDIIDTLEVAGTLLNAENLEPMPGIMIGLHDNLEDSAFVKLPFVRTSRTNDKGQFTIRNISPGKYHVFALNDVNRDYKFDQPGEDIAFLDSVIVPTFEFASRQDTIWKDSLTIDTILTVGYTHFLPDNIELRLFKEKFGRQYMLKPERTQENKLSLRFNSALDTIPALVPVNFAPADSSWYLVQEADGKTAIHYWLTDPLVWQQDTLFVSVTYPKSDSVNVLQAQTDTVQFLMRHRPDKKKKKKGDDADTPPLLGLNINLQGSMNLFDTISVVFDEPVVDLKKEVFFLDQKVDTLWKPVEFDFVPDTTNALGFFINRPWKYGEEYRLEIDSATIQSIYGKWNDFFTGEFKIKKKDEYGHLYINIIGVDTTAYVELLNGNDQPVRKAKVKDGGALFMDLKPDKYYARLVLDVNGNGKWDTGKYSDKQQPEKVFYCPKQLNVMQNWEVEETWDIHAAPFNRQKPLDITKNKPKELTKKKRDYKNEGRQSSSQNSGRAGMPF